MKPRQFHHSWRYYRNLLIVWMPTLTVLTFSLYSPPGLITLIWLLPMVWGLYILWAVYLQIHPLRFLTIPGLKPQDFSLPCEQVFFNSRDGLRLRGWLVLLPDEMNEAQPRLPAPLIILAHGRGGSCSQMLLHAKALAQAGYSSLLLDLRAHGKSQGDTSTFGMLEADDILGAVDYLLTRPEVDRERLGALGVSLGAQAVLTAALVEPSIRAVVLDGLGALTQADLIAKKTNLLTRLAAFLNAPVYRLADYMSGIHPQEGNRKALGRLGRPILLISAGKGGEQALNRSFYKAAREPRRLWEIPRAHHAAGITDAHTQYRQRVNSFFNEFLHPGESAGGQGTP
ncbi:MAG: alpha/beta fold hydrolase [Anaerolineales bacterium]|nr:alpha/beta fold hydrolase [Anaerolineales bacterium]